MCFLIFSQKVPPGEFLQYNKYFVEVLFHRSRTALGMDGTLHTDLAGFENIRDIKKVLYNYFNNLKS